MNILRQLLILALILSGAGFPQPHAIAEDSKEAKPSSKSLAEAVVGENVEARRRAAGWLASMNEEDILSVLEEVHKLSMRRTREATRFTLHATLEGRVAPSVRFGFTREQVRSADPSRDLLRALTEEPVWAQTGSQGVLEIDLPHGRYRIRIRRHGATDLVTNPIAIHELPGPVHLALGTAGVTVQVRDQRGAPVPGVAVDAWAQSSIGRLYCEPVASDGNGQVVLRSLPSGPWSFRARLDGGHVFASSVAQVTDGAVHVVQLQLPAHGFIALSTSASLGANSPEVEVACGAAKTRLRLSPMKLIRLAFPVGEVVLSFDGRSESIMVRDTQTITRTYP